MFKKKTFRADEVLTTDNMRAYSQDKDSDGTPDYLQRAQLRSLTKPVAETNLAEVDAKREMEEMAMGWRGYVYDTDISSWVPSSPPMINEIGINALINYIKSNVNKITMSTSISEEFAHKYTLYIMRTINGWLADKRRVWGIHFCDLSPISTQIDGFVFFTVSKSIGDKQRDHVTNRTRITETKTMPQATPSSV
jgi:hypothetical protein